MISLEQQARDMLERIGIEDVQSYSAGDLVELANLIGEYNRLKNFGAKKASEADSDDLAGPSGCTTLTYEDFLETTVPADSLTGAAGLDTIPFPRRLKE